MSWLARSLANSLRIDDNDNHLRTTSSNADDHHSQILQGRLHLPQPQLQASEVEDQDRTGGVKEDLSELTESITRQLWGVASFLAPDPPPPPPQAHLLSPTTSQFDRDPMDPYVSGQDDDHVSNSDFDDSRFEVGYGISDQMESIESVGVTEEALAFARNISHHPETWLDFPSSGEEDDDDFEMSDTQWNHVTLVERLAPRLAALRIELCPIHMSESYFWKVYFVLLHPRLNKHDADLLSTPQIVAARSMWMKELRRRTKPEPEPEPDISRRSDSVNQDFEPTSSEIPISDQPGTQEEGLIKTPLNTIRIVDENDDDNDDWIHENSELNGYVGADVHFGTDEDISFSDLEADDDCSMPVRSKIM